MKALVKVLEFLILFSLVSCSPNQQDEILPIYWTKGIGC
jgi:hypothetical protein